MLQSIRSKKWLSRSAIILRTGALVLVCAALGACNDWGERKVAPEAPKPPDTVEAPKIQVKVQEPEPVDPETLARLERIRSATMIDARRLGREYADSASQCELKYRERDLIVAGAVDSVGKDMLGRTFVSLGDPSQNDSLGVRCFFSSDDEGQLATLQPGQFAYFLGTCRGRVFNVLVEDCEWLDQTELAAVRADLVREEPLVGKTQEPVLTLEQQRVAREQAERDRIAKQKADTERRKQEAEAKVIAEKEQAEKLAASSLRLIQSLLKEGRVATAKTELKKLINTHPQTEAAVQARKLLMDLP